MPARLRLPAATWTLGDQALVSLGGFIGNLVLARSLAPEQYGMFSLFLLTILGLSTVTSSVLFYPMSVRATVASKRACGEVFGAGLLLLLAGSAPLAAALFVVLHLLGSTGLSLAVLVWFLLRQVQELFRRALFAEMRHAAALPGDTVCYFGQAAALLALAYWRTLTLENAVIVMAATSGIAALVQALQVPMRFCGIGRLRRVAQEWLALGAGSLGSNLLSTGRFQLFPWLLAAAGGTAAAANFQAAWNLVQLANPIILGLCNIIPQTSARGRAARGDEHAWQLSRPLMTLGAIPVFAYYALLCVLPGTILLLFYGLGSAYASLGPVVQLITLSAVFAYPADMVCSYLHGIEGVRAAMRINFVGLLGAIVVGVPLTLAFGITGACFSLLVAACVRSAFAYQVLHGVLINDRRRYA